MPWEATKRLPNTNRIATIGKSHSFFLTFKKSQNSFKKDIILIIRFYFYISFLKNSKKFKTHSNSDNNN